MHTLYHFFQGQWSFVRTIANHGTADGSVLFTPNASSIKPSLHYSETGYFYDLAKRAFKIHREYIYEFGDEKIDIYHANDRLVGNFFMPLLFSNQDRLATGQHLCRNDHYVAQFELLDLNQFQLNFKVAGPKKNYSIHTRFEKIAHQVMHEQ